MKMRITWLTGLLLGTLLSGGSLLQAQEFTALLSKREVPLGEVFKVSFQFKGAQNGRMEYPDLGAFQRRGSPSIESGFLNNNGQVTFSVTHSFFLQGKKTGTFTIGPASIDFKGKTYKTQPIKVKITSARANAGGKQADRSADLEAQLKEALFIRALLSKRQAYQGEQMTVTYKLYERVTPSNRQIEQNPDYEGFWVENLDEGNPTPRVEVFQGQQYRTLTVRKDVLFPQQNGKLTINPMVMASTVRIQAQRRDRRRSVFDDFFGNYEDYRYTFASPTLEVEVKPLPAGAPADFSGLVGDLDLDVRLDRTEAEVGEAFTLRIDLRGQGNMKKLPAPQLSLPPDFEVYDPTVKEIPTRTGGIIGGRRSYEYVIIPRSPGTYEWEPISYSYFDPQSQQYRTVSSEAYEVTVKGDPALSGRIASGGTVNQQEVALLDRDIRYIRTSGGELRPLDESPFRAWWFWLLYLLPFVAVVALSYTRRTQQARQQDVAGTLQRRAAKAARKRLKQAETHLQSQDEKAFYDEVVRSLWGYLGDKLRLAPSELSRDRIRQALLSQGATDPQAQQLHEILDTCELALFAPGAVVGGMQGVYDRSLSLITELEETLS